MDGVRRKAIGARQLGHRKEAPIGNIETIHKQPFRHARSQTRFSAVVNRNPWEILLAAHFPIDGGADGMGHPSKV